MDKTVIGRFLNTLFENPIAGTFINVTTIKDGDVVQHWYGVGENDTPELLLDRIGNFCASQSGKTNIYISASGYSAKRRLAKNVVVLYGFWLDIDFGQSGHKKTNLPPDIEAIKAILRKMPDCTMVVHSGHGLQVWFLFKEPWILDTPEEHAKATEFSLRINQTLIAWAEYEGYTADNVGDLSRVMRVPGTFNIKEEPQVLATIMSEIGTRWNPDDLIDALVMPEVARRPLQQINVDTDHLAGDLIVAADRMPPADKLLDLIETSRKFKNFYYGKDESPTDASTSGTDFTMALIAGKANWKPQEICDLLILAGKKRGRELKHPGYYKKTIGKVIAATRDEAETTAALDEAENVRNDSTKTPEEKADALYISVKRSLGIEFDRPIYSVGTRIQDGKEIQRGDRHYKFVGGRGLIRLSANDIYSQITFTRMMSDIGLVVRKTFPNAEWKKLAGDIIECSFEDKLGEGETPESQLISALISWINNTKRPNAESQIRMEDKSLTSPFLWSVDGGPLQLAFNGSALDHYLKMSFVEIKKRGVLLRDIGAIDKTVAFRDGNTIRAMSAWILPSEGEGNERWKLLAERMSDGLTGISQAQLEAQQERESEEESA